MRLLTTGVVTCSLLLSNVESCRAETSSVAQSLLPVTASAGATISPGSTSENTVLPLPADQDQQLGASGVPSPKGSGTGTAPESSSADEGDNAVSVAPPASATSDFAMWGAAAVSPVPLMRRPSGLASAVINHAAENAAIRSEALASRITDKALLFLGTPYVFGGTHVSGFDCSGYVQHVFEMVGIALPRTADEQFSVGRHVDSDHMTRGDLVFFETYAAGASHVGIYLGNDEFIHSSSSRGVMVSSLHDSYWSAHYLGAERVL